MISLRIIMKSIFFAFLPTYLIIVTGTLRAECAEFFQNMTVPKVRVNILYLALEIDDPLLYRSTFEKHLPPAPDPQIYNESHNNYKDVFRGAVPWLANDQLQNVDVYVSHRDTKYDVNFNLQTTMATVLELLVAKTTDDATTCTTDDGRKSQLPPVVHIIVGPGFSSEVKAIFQFTSFYNLAMIGGEATSPTLSDRAQYPYFFRTCPSDGDGPDVVANVLTYFGYDQVNALYQDEGYILDFRELFEPNLAGRGIKLENSFIYGLHNNVTYVRIAEILGSKAKSHVWVLPIATSQYELFCAMYQYGHMTGTTHLGVFFGEVIGTTWYLPPTSAKTTGKNESVLYANDCTIDQIKEVVRGALQIAPGDADYDNRPSDVGLRATEFHSDMQAAYEKRGKSANTFYSYLYFQFDALLAATLALDRAEKDLRENYNTSLAYFRYNDTRVVKNLVRHLSNLSFEGLTGPVAFSATGNRVNSGWVLRQFQDWNFVDVARYEAKNATSYNITFHRQLNFPTDDGKPPPQFTVVQPWATPLNLALVILAALIAVGAAAFGYIYFRRRAKEAALLSILSNTKHWFIEPSALTLDNGDSTSQSQMFTSSSLSIGQYSNEQASLKTPFAGGARGIKRRRGIGGGATRLPYLSYKYDGSMVCLFELQPLSSTAPVIGREFAANLLRIQACSHENLSRFVGMVQMSVDGANYMHVVMADSPKGTLSDFLADSKEEVELDETCSFLFLTDLQKVNKIFEKGLSEVHKQLGHHGRLSSTVCSIDNRLSLRISDYGFGAYREKSFYYSDHPHYDNWLWTAPEVIQTLITIMDKQEQELTPTAAATASHSQNAIDWGRADIYSFGIIMAEVFTQCSPPFEEQLKMKTAQRLLKDIAYSRTAQNIWQEQLEGSKVAHDITELALGCMAGDAVQRPTLAEVGAVLRRMMKMRHLSDNLTETLMQRLETHATELASLVDQRTAALVEEENKVRRLLYQILPPTVADALKNGEAVPPTTYDSVTIYFSDIVGFTTISAQSTPLEIVDFLNDLYNTFDHIICKFDVYKVETIGDAYMVASGLPTPNGLEHARNIVRMSLALIDHVTSVFRIRHRPNEQLLLRIGLHSGPCAAGVVGFVMPRYCLFGDTVNTASRMESTSLPLKIHASEATAKTLASFEGQSAPEFSLESRGELDIKGKGLMHTFWVTKTVQETV